MKYLTLLFPSLTLLALYRKMYYPQIFTPNLLTPIYACCLATVIFLMWLRAYHTVKLLESGEFAPQTYLWKNDWVNLQIIWKEGAAYFSTKKNRNVKEPIVSSHTTTVWETASTPFMSIGYPSTKIQAVQNLSWANHGCLQTTKQSEKYVGAGRDL